MIATGVYKLSATDYMKELIRLWLYARWYVVAIPIVPFIGLSFVNLKFVYVSLMVLFIVIPMMLAYVYFFYALSEDCAESIRRCRVEMHPECLIRFYVGEDGVVLGKKTYAWSRFSAYEVTDTMLRLDKRGKKFEFQLIPLASLGEAGRSLLDLCLLLDKKMEK